MIEIIKDFVEVLLAQAPQLAPQVKDAVHSWGKIKNVDTSELVMTIRDSREKQVDARIDKAIDNLDLPEK